MSDPIIIIAKPGQQIDHFCAQLVVIAWCAEAPIHGRFNDHLIVAKPGCLREDLLQQWSDQANDVHRW